MSRIKLIDIGEITVYAPEEYLFDIATLKKDLRPVIKALERIRDDKPHPGRPKKVHEAQNE